MKATEITQRIIAALQPILDDASTSGLLVGGQMRVLTRSHGSWQLGHRINITQQQIIEELSPTATQAGELTGELCFKCGSSRMNRAGACLVCLDCGESGGCG